MPQTLDYVGLVSVFRAAAAKVKSGTDELSELDSAIGDGDHGVAMGRAMDALVKGIEECPAEDVGTLIQGVAWSVMSIDAGSTGPLMGSLFMGMVEPVGEATETLEDFYEPYLIQGGFLKRTSRGRMVTDLAYKHLSLYKRKNEDQELLF